MAKKGKLIVLTNKTRHKELMADYKAKGWWLSRKGDRAARQDQVVHFVVLEIYIEGIDQLNDFYGVEADFDAAFAQLNDLKKVLDVTKDFVERPELNKYPDDKKKEI